MIPRNYLVYLAQMWLWSWSLLLFCGLIIEWWGHASGQNVWRPIGRQDPASLSLKLDIYPLSPLKSMLRQALSVVYCFDLREWRQKRSYCISLLEISCFKSNGKVAVKESYFAQDQISSLSSKISGSTQLRESGVFKNFNSMIAFPKIEISVTGVF